MCLPSNRRACVSELVWWSGLACVCVHLAIKAPHVHLVALVWYEKSEPFVRPKNKCISYFTFVCAIKKESWSGICPNKGCWRAAGDGNYSEQLAISLRFVWVLGKQARPMQCFLHGASRNNNIK